MSTAQVAIEQDVIDRRIPMGRLRDTSAVIKRNLLQYIRVPQLLVFSTVQPIIFVLMFRFVFGGSINTGRIPYVDYLMPGIFLQVVVFGSLATAIGLATDLKSGLMERFHALPMWTPAVLVGRTLADLLRNVFVVILMMVVGFLVGWRIHTTLLALVPGVLLVLLFGYAMSWIFATIGLAVKDPETAQAAAFPILAPLVFASASFVPVERHAGLAATVVQEPARLGDGRVVPRPHDRRADADARDQVDPVVGPDHRDLRAHRGAPVPQGRVAAGGTYGRYQSLVFDQSV